jgi:hypothetical protein
VNQYGDITANSASVGSLAVGGGNLTVDASGYLSAAAGYFTVGSNGSFSAANTNFVVNASGYLSAAAGYFTVGSNGSFSAANTNFVVNASGATTASGGASFGNGGFVVDGSGNVGIQNSSPNYALDVTGNINVTNTLYQNGTAGASCTSDVTTTVNGVVIGCGLSDARYKTDITTMATSTLDKLDQLNAVSFHWNDVYKDKYTNNSDLQFGFIAQEVQGIFPDLVSEDKNGYFSVRYGQMTAILTSGIQELYAMVKDLKAQVADIGNTLGDKVVHIKETITGTLRVEDKVCVDDVCVTKNQFKQMLINNGANNNGSVSGDNAGVSNSNEGNVGTNGGGGNSADSNNSGSGTSAPSTGDSSSNTSTDGNSTNVPVDKNSEGEESTTVTSMSAASVSSSGTSGDGATVVDTGGSGDASSISGDTE